MAGARSLPATLVLEVLLPSCTVSGVASGVSKLDQLQLPPDASVMHPFSLHPKLSLPPRLPADRCVRARLGRFDRYQRTCRPLAVRQHSLSGR